MPPTDQENGPGEVVAFASTIAVPMTEPAAKAVIEDAAMPVTGAHSGAYD